MIFLIHLLQHLGIASGVAIAIVIVARKLVKGAISGSGGRRDRDRGRRHHRDYR